MTDLPFDSRDLLDPGANWCPDCGLPRNHPECRCDEFFEPTEEDWQRVLNNDCQLCPDCGGTGVNDPNFDGWDDEGYTPCSLCHGQGQLDNEETK